MDPPRPGLSEVLPHVFQLGPASWLGGWWPISEAQMWIHPCAWFTSPPILIPRTTLSYRCIYLSISVFLLLLASLIWLLTCRFFPICSFTVSRLYSLSLSCILWSSGATTWWSLTPPANSTPGPFSPASQSWFLLAALHSFTHASLPSCFFFFLLLGINSSTHRAPVQILTHIDPQFGFSASPASKDLLISHLLLLSSVATFHVSSFLTFSHLSSLIFLELWCDHSLSSSSLHAVSVSLDARSPVHWDIYYILIVLWLSGSD